MTKTIIITSGKGGVGKTTISVNTAIELAQRNYRTCLLDADLGLANINILLGIQPEYTLDDYILGDKTLDEIRVRTKFGVDIIPGSSAIEKMAHLGKDEISRLISSCSELTGYDFFLIGTSSKISRGVLAFCLASRETIIVITAEATSLTDAYALLKVMSVNNYRGTVKILVNKSPSVPKAKETYLRFKKVVNKHLNIHIAPVGAILSDPGIDQASSNQQPALIFPPESLASQCIKAMVSKLLKKNSTQHQEEDFRGFWRRYFKYAFPGQTVPENKGRAAQTSLSQKTLELKSSKADSPLPGPGAESFSPPLQEGWIIDPAALSPPLPILSKVLAMQTRGEIAEDILLDIFCSDPVLMVKALKVFCSGHSGARNARRLTTKRQLLEVLGKESLTSLLNTTAIQRAQLSPQSAERAKTANSLWLHSYQSALIAEKIAEITGYQFPEEAFIAGLIHDIGRIALQTSHPLQYRHTADTSSDDLTLADLEKRHFNVSHAELGARAFRAWQLDNRLVDAAQYHNEPFARIETAFSLVQIIFLANRLSRANLETGEISDQGKILFGFSTVQMQEISTATAQETKHLAKQLGILQPAPINDQVIAKTEARFRQQLMDYLLVKNVLPATTNDDKEISEKIHTISQAFTLLFNFQASYLLVVDHQQQLLKAIDFPACFAAESVSDIQFSLLWQKSLVVQSCTTCDLTIAIDEENSDSLPLADRQLLRALGTQGFVCVPLATRASTVGVIVFGIATSQVDAIQSVKERLLQFGHLAARNISLMENMSV